MHTGMLRSRRCLHGGRRHCDTPLLPTPPPRLPALLPLPQVLRSAQAAAEERIRAGAVQAMAALTAAELGPAVIGTAAAIVAEIATAAAEQRLRAYVPSALRRTATEQLQQLLAAAAKGAGRAARQAAGAAPPAAAGPASPPPAC